jgi:hypothetical protein
MSQKKEGGGIFGAIKGLIVEEDATPTTTKPATPVAATPTAAPLPSLNLSAAAPLSLNIGGMTPVTTNATVATSEPENDDAYQRLLTRTDFEKTDAGQTIRKYLEQLAPVPETVMPAATKQTTAILQAKAELGEVRILGAFDTLKATLSDEQQKFSAKAQQFEQSQIVARQQRITAIQDQITQLQKEMSDTATALSEAQGKAARAQGAFAVAVQRRSNEIDQQKAQYTALLGK